MGICKISPRKITDVKEIFMDNAVALMIAFWSLLFKSVVNTPSNVIFEVKISDELSRLVGGAVGI